MISGGTIVDGTGTPGRIGRVVVDGERLRILAPDAVPPEHVGATIDATGKVVAPGFIDLHSHGGLVILADGRHEPKVRQGVTTEVIGVDGNGFAPFLRREDLEAFVNLDAGLDGRPDLDYDWTSVASFLARFDGTVSLNIATLVGNSQLRIGVLGWDDVPADAPALDRMRGLLRDGDGRRRVRPELRSRLPAGRLCHDRGARHPHGGGRPPRWLLPHARPVSARRSLPRPDPRGDRDRPARGRRPRTSPTSTIARRTRAARSRSSP